MIMTLLIPLLMACIVFIPARLTQIKEPGIKNITVIDQTGRYENAFHSNELYQFYLINQSAHFPYEESKNDALIVISDNLSNNPDGITIYSDRQVNPELKSYISGLLSPFVRDEKLQQYDIPNLKEIVEKVNINVDIQEVRWTNTTEEEASTEIVMATSLTAAILIYFFILMYGSLVMRGVVEEKTNRIVEIIISSVNSFELMAGKIIGIALVGLTQFLIWVALIVVVGSIFGSGLENEIMQKAVLSHGSESDILSGNSFFSVFSFSYLITTGVFFVIYFIGGYLLYASLFAAIGAASDSETDTQQFMLPLTFLVTFALFIAIYSINNPDSTLTFWCSMIPFTSPIVMVVRIPLGVPFWEIILSVLILFFSFISITRIAAKIYRTGILMYGKKVTYKEIWKWVKNG